MERTPCLIFSTELPLDGHVTVHALCAKGSGGWLGSPNAESGGLDAELSDINHFPQIHLPSSGDEARISIPGFHVTPERYEWFGHVLARTAAAGLTPVSRRSNRAALVCTLCAQSTSPT